MIRALFVLDFDGTYDLEFGDMGVEPVVYLVPEDAEVYKLARKASEMFHGDMESDWSIGDYFEDLMKKADIEYQEVGYLNIPFEERQVDYISNNIQREVV